MSGVRAGFGWLVTFALATAILAHAAGAMTQQALDNVGLVSIAWAVFRFGERRWAGAWSAGAGAVVLAGGLALLQSRVPDLHYMPWLLIGLANMATAWVFASGLLPGREPVLARLIMLMGLRPIDDPRFRRFIFGQCLLWAALAIATACAACFALVGISAHPWLKDLLAGLVAIQVLWFVLSHYYAAHRFGRPETWWGTARAMARPDTWSRLRLQ